MPYMHHPQLQFIQSEAILKVCTTSFNPLHFYILIVFDVFWKLHEVAIGKSQVLNHKWYNVNHFVNELINS